MNTRGCCGKNALIAQRRRKIRHTKERFRPRSLWEKGKAVDWEFRGVDSQRNYWQLEKETGRPHPDKKGKYQLAYGHHRWIALKELKYKEIDIPCREIPDATMVQIMAEENLNWSTAPAVMVQTIASTKEFLDRELRKYKSWEQATNEEFLSGIFPEPIILKRWEQLKKNGVGRGKRDSEEFLRVFPSVRPLRAAVRGLC